MLKVSEQCGMSASKCNQILGLFRRTITYKVKKKVKSSPRHYALGSHEGLYGQCLNLVSVVRSNLECSYTDSPGRNTSPSQVPSKQCLYSFAAE